MELCSATICRIAGFHEQDNVYPLLVCVLFGWRAMFSSVICTRRFCCRLVSQHRLTNGLQVLGLVVACIIIVMFYSPV